MLTIGREQFVQSWFAMLQGVGKFVSTPPSSKHFFVLGKARKAVGIWQRTVSSCKFITGPFVVCFSPLAFFFPKDVPLAKIFVALKLLARTGLIRFSFRLSTGQLNIISPCFGVE
jgi:hypothetical protein